MDRYDHLAVKFVRYSLLLFSSLVPIEVAFATSNGIGGYSGVTRDCTNCHTNVATAATATLTGAASVAPNSVNTYTLVVSGGPAVEAGMDVSADGGMLAATMTGTKMSGADVVHSSPGMVTNGSATYTFGWTAPMSNGTYTIYAAGLSSNNQNNSGGDATAVTKLMVSVSGVPVPTDPGTPPPVPNPSGTGAELFNANCSGCHSSGGAGGSIAGESAKDILEAFAEKSVHAAVAAALNSADVAAIAAYLKTLGNAEHDGDYDDDDDDDDSSPVTGDTAAGQALFDANCSGCHGSGGAGGSITGSSSKDIREAFAEKSVHAGVAATLSSTDIAAIAAYLKTGSKGGSRNDLTAAVADGSGGDPSAAASVDLLVLALAGGLAALRRRR
ncbi:MAG: c-type cytochrome [Gammaproteobacteria bacterium]|nr:c-type cytochrome [Gammaproteobacteria bacterium]